MQSQSSKEFIEQLKAISTPVIHGTQSRFLSSILKHGLNYELSSLHCEHKHNHFIMLNQGNYLNENNSYQELVGALFLAICYATHGNLADINFSGQIENLFIHYTKNSSILLKKNTLIRLIISTLLRKISHKHLKRKTKIKGKDLGCPLLLIYEAKDKTLIHKNHHIEVGIKESLPKESLKIVLAPEKYLPYIEYIIEQAFDVKNTITVFPIEIIEQIG